MFLIEADSGVIFLTRPLDREKETEYFLKIRAEDTARSRSARSVGVRQLESYYLAYDETLVLVSVGDENDNSPVFQNGIHPIVAVVPLEAVYGFEIAQVKASDVDKGYNAAIRYQIIQEDRDSSSKFHIDPLTGVIRSMMTFSLDSGREFQFHVKATDREASETGRSALTHVIVYVLPETKLIVIVCHTRPLVMEQNIEKVLGYLSNATGYRIQMSKLQSHHQGQNEDPERTDLFLYGVERETNKIINTDQLLKIFIKKSDAIREGLSQFRIQKIEGVSVQQKISHMGTTEVAIIALSSVIFLGGVLGIALLCSTCKKRKTKQQQEKWEQERVFRVRNTLIDESVGPPYERRVANKADVFHPPSYSNTTSNT
ncbi:cadherin-89D-like [Tachypleus tridentatus]